MVPDRNDRLKEVAGIAVRLEAETGLPAQLLIAQWALESKWGVKPAGNANYFGMKKTARHSRCCTVTTHEVINGRREVMDLKFADYGSLEESCRDYAWLITWGAPYRSAWSQYQRDKNLDGLIAGVARVYATDPAYADLISQIAGQSNIAAAIAAARGNREMEGAIA